MGHLSRYFRRLAAFAVFIVTLAVGPVGAVNVEGANQLPASTSDIDGDERSRGGLRSERAFHKAFRAAHRLIEEGQYQQGIAALRALRHDVHPAVASDLGYASHKLGNYDDAKFWYEKALTANPQHVRTWSRYGIWHAEQGNWIKAHGYLEKVRAIGGTTCREYSQLRNMLRTRTS